MHKQISHFIYLFKVGAVHINKHLHVNMRDYSQRLTSVRSPSAARVLDRFLGALHKKPHKLRELHNNRKQVEQDIEN